MIRIVVALALASVVIGGQAQAAPAKAKPAGAKAAAYHAPRGPDGKHPDLNGVWQVMNTANWNIEPHAASAALQMRPGPVVPVPAKDVLALGAVGSVPAGLGVVDGGAIPYTPEALKQRDANKADWIQKDPEIKCYLPGVPRANYMALPFQIFQSESATLIAYEYAGAVRNIMKVVERWTPAGPGVMRYEAEITDPATFTRPWKMSMNLYRHVGEDARLQQFKCVEFVEELMYGHLRKEPLK